MQFLCEPHWLFFFFYFFCRTVSKGKFETSNCSALFFCLLCLALQADLETEICGDDVVVVCCYIVRLYRLWRSWYASRGLYTNTHTHCAWCVRLGGCVNKPLCSSERKVEIAPDTATLSLVLCKPAGPAHLSLSALHGMLRYCRRREMDLIISDQLFF